MKNEYSIVPEPLREELSRRQIQSLAGHYRKYWTWLAESGKIPARDTGFSFKSVRTKFHRTTQFHRWVWNRIGRYTTRFTRAHADQFERGLDENKIQTEEGETYTESSKRKHQQAVVTYFDFQSCCLGGKEWSPNLIFSQSEYNQSDYFTLDERDRLYQAALTYDDLGKYGNLSPEARKRNKRYLAQKLEKPKSEVTPEDFDRCRTSWKIPSLISVSLDLGARPAFIERCSHEWHKPEKEVFQIPKDDAAKNDAYWESSLSSRSNYALQQWIPQRKASPKYDGTEHLWLTREGSPYQSGSLNYLLDQLVEEADVDISNRKLTWTSIRRSTATYLAYFHSLVLAKEQLRHKSIQSTVRYVEIPVEARQNTLNQMRRGIIDTTKHQGSDAKIDSPVFSPEVVNDG